MVIISKKDLIKSLTELNINESDTVMVHSSLKSFGNIDGGANTVISAFLEKLTTGTLIFPAFRQKDFYHSYDNWDIDTTPSDVGIISETFRNMPNVLRSNQETHSVCAIGKNAEYITKDHSKGLKRIGVYGDTPFSYSSPYQKMYEMNAKIVLLGVDFDANTFGHYVEYRYVNDLIASIEDENIKKEAISHVLRFENMKNLRINNVPLHKELIWPWFNRVKMQKYMTENSLLKNNKCGECEIIVFNVKDFVDNSLKQLKINPLIWTNCEAVMWHKKYSKK